MRAVVCDRYGPPEVLHLADVAPPVPAGGEVLVRVRATTVNRTDCGVRSGRPWFGRAYYGPLKPRWPILGYELAGVVEAVGAGVTAFKPGDEVFGVNAGRFGANAELVCMKQDAPLAPMPAGATFEQAAAVCDGVILALMCLRRAHLRSGRSILVYGASGSIGSAAVQLARYAGAEVTAVCATKNVELMKSLGADEAIDYTREDFTGNGRAYDVIFDAVGKLSFRRCRGSLRSRGIYLATDGLANLGLALVTRFAGKKVVFPIPPRYTKNDVVYIKQLMEAGRYRAVIDRRYDLDDVVEATCYVESEQKTGNVVLVVAGKHAG